MNKRIVGLVGTHGVGKTTLMLALKEKGFDVVEGSLSRTAQEKLGWSDLKRVMDSFENMLEFQNMILTSMEERDKAINERPGDGVVIVDRTPADVMAYVELWASAWDGSEDDVVERTGALILFWERCAAAMERYLCQIFVPVRKEIPFIEQRNRASEDTREKHQAEILDFLFANKSTRVRVLVPTDIDERVAEVKACINRSIHKAKRN